MCVCVCSLESACLVREFNVCLAVTHQHRTNTGGQHTHAGLSMLLLLRDPCLSLMTVEAGVWSGSY